MMNLIDRKRRALALAFTAAALGTMTLLYAQSPLNQIGQHLQGAWIADVITQSGTQKLLIFFTADGGVISSSPTGLGAQGVQLLTTGYGSWIRTGDREFAATTTNLRSFLTGVFNGGSKVRFTLKLNDTLDELTGPFKTDIFNADGSFAFSLAGEQRMK